MSEGMTEAKCRMMQDSCSEKVFLEIASLRKETKDDIAKIREAVQAIDRSVSAIKGFLGLNGGGSTENHTHKRKDDETEKLHQRLSDAIIATQEATKELQRRSTDLQNSTGITLPRWAVMASAGLLLLIVLLAAIAGERSIPIIFDGIEHGSKAVK